MVHGGPSFGVEQETGGGACSAGGGAPVWSKRLGAGLGAWEAEPGCGAICWGRDFERGRRSPSVEEGTWRSLLVSRLGLCSN